MLPKKLISMSASFFGKPATSVTRRHGGVGVHPDLGDVEIEVVVVEAGDGQERFPVWPERAAAVVRPDELHRRLTRRARDRDETGFGRQHPRRLGIRCVVDHQHVNVVKPPALALNEPGVEGGDGGHGRAEVVFRDLTLQAGSNLRHNGCLSRAVVS